MVTKKVVGVLQVFQVSHYTVPSSRKVATYRPSKQGTEVKIRVHTHSLTDSGSVGCACTCVCVLFKGNKGKKKLERVWLRWFLLLPLFCF